MRRFLPFVFFAFFSFVPIAWPAPEVAAEAAGNPWGEMRLEAASFAADWLTDLDNQAWPLAAKSYAPFEFEGNAVEAGELLAARRRECGDFSERLFLESTVFAVANDDSECRVRVRYQTRFSRQEIVETVEILCLKGAPMRVTAYRLEAPPENSADGQP